MEIEDIEKDCWLCGDEAKATIKGEKRTLELCSDCARKMLWELVHADYNFTED